MNFFMSFPPVNGGNRCQIIHKNHFQRAPTRTTVTAEPRHDIPQFVTPRPPIVISGGFVGFSRVCNGPHPPRQSGRSRKASA